MASTVIAGKPSNTVGEKDSTLILRGSSVKVLWGNKFIDIIKNGKINADTDILKVAKDTNELNTDGIYLIDNSVWAVIKGTKIELTGEVDNAYISYLIELKDLTADLKNLALTNIGFYYNTLEDAQAAEIKAGIIYVQNDNKLYVVKDGTISEYLINPLKNDQENLEGSSEIIELTGLYIKDYSLWVNDYEHANFENSAITLFYLLITDYSGIKSFGSTNSTGFRLYIDEDNKSVLELDKLELRIYPTRVTFLELYNLILNSGLKPKKYYMITDFLNPWEVTWEDELMFYKHEYQEINGVLRMIGHRNAMHLIVLAANYNTLELTAWSLENPKWIMHYDPYYLGPEHGKQYGFRSRINDEGEVEYLSCKGIITYLKDEFGNEGNFNFRHLLFKRGSFWRYCMDTGLGDLFGEFFEGHNNSFMIDSLDIVVQVFIFKLLYNTDNTVSGVLVIIKDSDIIILNGHNLYICTTSVENNDFTLPAVGTNISHSITSIIDNNKFLGFTKSITVKNNAINNTFSNISGTLTIKIKCSNNTLNNFLDNVLITGSLFNNNNLTNFSRCFNNSGTFNGNNISLCLGIIANSNSFINNKINNIGSNLSITEAFENNIIGTIINVSVYDSVENNIINSISESLINKSFCYNKFKSDINLVNFKGVVLDNISIANINNCNFEDFINNRIYETISDSISKNILNCIFNLPVKDFISNDLINCEFYEIDDLEIEVPVFYTTFHGHIGQITRLLTDYELELLLDSSKKKEAYPNIRIICVPEIIMKGMILMWYGEEPIPKGWALCDGKNGTPNLVGSFIKGDLSTASEPTIPEDVDPETNEFTLKTDHLPKHSHPHKAHQHSFEGTGGGTITDDYAYEGSSYYVNSGEGTSTKSGETWYQTSEDESISINISGNTSSVTSEEDGWRYNDPPKPIKLEPKHFKIIFIMKIDENLEYF